LLVSGAEWSIWYSTFTGEMALRPFREERGTCRQSLWHCDCWHNTSTLNTVNYLTWSGVFNKLKFDCLLKKKRRRSLGPAGQSLEPNSRPFELDCRSLTLDSRSGTGQSVSGAGRSINKAGWLFSGPGQSISWLDNQSLGLDARSLGPEFTPEKNVYCRNKFKINYSKIK